MEAGRSMTSPAAILLVNSSGKTKIFPAKIDSSHFSK
jgi:hypothetical protein